MSDCRFHPNCWCVDCQQKHSNQVTELRVGDKIEVNMNGQWTPATVDGKDTIGLTFKLREPEYTCLSFEQAKMLVRPLDPDAWKKGYKIGQHVEWCNTSRVELPDAVWSKGVIAGFRREAWGDSVQISLEQPNNYPLRGGVSCGLYSASDMSRVRPRRLSIGDRVKRKNGHGHLEEGTVVGWHETLATVRFTSSDGRSCYYSQWCDVSDLEYLPPAETAAQEIEKLKAEIVRLKMKLDTELVKYRQDLEVERAARKAVEDRLQKIKNAVGA